MSTQYRIKNWHKFQHFKDRRPPWIKLYREVLDDIEWHRLDPEHAKVLIALWLIASEHDGNLPNFETLAFRLRTTEKAVIAHVSALSHWLICDDITAISPRYQDDTPEKRREEIEKEGERETKAGIIAEPDHLSSVPGFTDAWQTYLENRIAKKAKATPKAQALILATLAEHPERTVKALNEAVIRNWTGFKWEWIDASNGKGVSHSTAKLTNTWQSENPHPEMTEAF
jgi:hypothetical protein